MKVRWLAGKGFQAIAAVLMILVLYGQLDQWMVKSYKEYTMRDPLIHLLEQRKGESMAVLNRQGCERGIGNGCIQSAEHKRNTDNNNNNTNHDSNLIKNDFMNHDNKTRIVNHDIRKLSDSYKDSLNVSSQTSLMTVDNTSSLQKTKVTNLTQTHFSDSTPGLPEWKPILSTNVLSHVCHHENLVMLNNSQIIDRLISRKPERNECKQFYSDMLLTKYVLENFYGACSDFNPRNITMVLQMDLHGPNFIKLRQILAFWQGPVSLSLYFKKDIGNSSSQYYFDFIAKLIAQYQLDVNKLCVHVVIGSKSDRFFPINTLRNIAIKNSQSDMILISEADFIVPSNMIETVQRHMKEVTHPRTAFVVPAFATEYKNFTMPHTRTELLKQWRENITLPVQALRQWKLGHSPTRYDKLQNENTSQIYEVFHGTTYEPYYIINKTQSPYYAEELAFGCQDKAVHALMIHRLGFKFMVMFDTFMVHTFHINRSDKERFKSIRMNYSCKMAALYSMHDDLKILAERQAFNPKLAKS